MPKMADEEGRARAHTVTEFLKEAREHMRKRHLSLKTERAYLYRMRQFIEFHGRRHPSNLGGEEISAYLSHLAINDRVAASTQNVALNGGWAGCFDFQESCGKVVREVTPDEVRSRPRDLSCSLGVLSVFASSSAAAVSDGVADWDLSKSRTG